MTEEIEAHVLKKYEILQKLGKSSQNRSFFAKFSILALFDFTLSEKPMLVSLASHQCFEHTYVLERKHKILRGLLQSRQI